jgi:alginate O-acetyltransferase complex protein AlgI
VYFLPTLLVTYFLTPNKYKNVLLLLASIFFYSWGAPKFIFVILITTCFDYFIVRSMDRQQDLKRRKWMMIFSVSINVGLLFYFKYCNFFIDNINELLGGLDMKPMKLLSVILPIGISFYTFESLTYVIDVYMKKHKPLSSFLNYLLYIILFPKLIAGPIIRYHEIAAQITNRFANYSIDMILIGFRRFAIGLAKKVIIANTLAIVSEQIFAIESGELSTYYAWLGMITFTLQIYFDFSGYSDMAIGIGQMLGFTFPENFNNPYASIGITQFWRRWHISLGNWMKNYLYIPLGGNKVETKSKLFFNLWIVFLLSGFWHGANWTFIFWGAYHGFWLIMDRLGFESGLNKLGKIPGAAITFFIVAIGWVYFNSIDMAHANAYVASLVDGKQMHLTIEIDPMFWFAMSLGLIFSFWQLVPKLDKIQVRFYFETLNLRSTISYTFVSFAIMIVCISYIATSQFNPFIYFRF